MTAVDDQVYACPKCKHVLEQSPKALSCRFCRRDFPIRDGIPDFLLEDLAQSPHPILRGVKSIDWLSRIYESKWWYPLVLNVYGGFGSVTFDRLVHAVAGEMEAVSGRILDVACGPGTFGRRIASPSKEVYGIDMSMGMLRRGTEYARRDRVPNMHFCRAKVETLPFRDAFFDAAICCGSLHLFADTVAALKEIGRTLKPGGALAGFTFTAGKAGILKYRWIREHVRKGHGIQVLELPELEGCLRKAGFGGFRPECYGSVLIFAAGAHSGGD
jgi:ubiquinone/menaquinone biosynthesis C-methylase UbiE/uncharacterized protein YbaR (Trm112 family)